MRLMRLGKIGYYADFYFYPVAIAALAAYAIWQGPRGRLGAVARRLRLRRRACGRWSSTCCTASSCITSPTSRTCTTPITRISWR